MFSRLLIAGLFVAMATPAFARGQEDPLNVVDVVAVSAQLPPAPDGPPAGVPLAPSAQRPTPQPQQPPQPQPQPGRTTPAAPAPAAAPPPVAIPEPPRRVRGKELNVQIELTITDQMGSSAPEKKVVSLLAADSTMGRVRANARASKANVGFVGTGLNVDARPMVLESGAILLELTLEYSPLRESAATQEPTNLNESISVVLVNGKAMTISQAADPISDRKMTVEVKATILK